VPTEGIVDDDIEDGGSMNNYVVTDATGTILTPPTSFEEAELFIEASGETNLHIKNVRFMPLRPTTSTPTGATHGPLCDHPSCKQRWTAIVMLDAIKRTYYCMHHWKKDRTERKGGMWSAEVSS
jgi:hypothetical protein